MQRHFWANRRKCMTVLQFWDVSNWFKLVEIQLLTFKTRSLPSTSNILQGIFSPPPIAVSHRAAFQHPSHHTWKHPSRAQLCKHSLGTDHAKVVPVVPTPLDRDFQGLVTLFFFSPVESVYEGQYVTMLSYFLWSWLTQADRSTVFYMFTELFAIKADSLKIKEKEGCGILLQCSSSQKCCCVVLGYGLMSQIFPSLKWREISEHHYP